MIKADPLIGLSRARFCMPSCSWVSSTVACNLLPATHGRRPEELRAVVSGGFPGGLPPWLVVPICYSCQSPVVVCLEIYSHLHISVTFICAAAAPAELSCIYYLSPVSASPGKKTAQMHSGGTKKNQHRSDVTPDPGSGIGHSAPAHRGGHMQNNVSIEYNFHCTLAHMHLHIYWTYRWHVCGAPRGGWSSTRSNAESLL